LRVRSEPAVESDDESLLPQVPKARGSIAQRTKMARE
jgi:hypothetical protein